MSNPKNLALLTEYQLHAVFAGDIEVDESYFGGTRKGKLGRGSTGQSARIWHTQAGWQASYEYYSRCKQQPYLPTIARKVIPDSIVYSNCWHGYNVLHVADFKHYRIYHSKLFADKQNHINSIENFWNQAKRNMRKFSGVPKANF